MTLGMQNTAGKVLKDGGQYQLGHVCGRDIESFGSE
jgi:hypothetical protein